MTILRDNDVVSRNPPKISIIVAAYNATRYISQALDSIATQTFTDYELIVINDGSRDREELEKILHDHPLAIRYLSQENRGVSAARNAGIRIARGSFYAQLDADDQWKPEYLEVQLGMLLANPDASLVYPNAMIIGSSLDAGLEFMNVCPSEGEVTFESLVRQKCTVMTSVTARMEVIRGAGMFDESCRSCEDFDLWLRIVKKGGRIIYHRKILALYRRHEHSLSSDRVWMMRHLVAVLEKTEKTAELLSVERDVLKHELTNVRATLNLFQGKHALKQADARTALSHFKLANEQLHSFKLRLVIFLLRVVPKLVIWGYQLRDRLLEKSPAHRLTGFDNPHIPADGVIRTNQSAFLL